MSQQPINCLSSVAAIVLAGGQSSRMGHDKALIEVQGVPLLKRTCLVALRCTSSVRVVTFHPEKYCSLLPPDCQLVTESPLSNQSTPHGPLVGFAQGLAHIQTDWVLLLACDLPFLKSKILHGWIHQLTHTEAEILLPHSQKGWEPLCGFYRTSCLSRLTALIHQGERSFQRWLTQENVQAIQFSDNPEICAQEHQMLFNCNTPEELATMRRERSTEDIF